MKRGVNQLLGFTNSPPVQLTKNGKAFSSNGEEANKTDGTPSRDLLLPVKRFLIFHRSLRSDCLSDNYHAWLVQRERFGQPPCLYGVNSCNYIRDFNNYIIAISAEFSTCTYAYASHQEHGLQPLRDGCQAGAGAPGASSSENITW